MNGFKIEAEAEIIDYYLGLDFNSCLLWRKQAKMRQTNYWKTVIEHPHGFEISGKVILGLRENIKKLDYQIKVIKIMMGACSLLIAYLIYLSPLFYRSMKDVYIISYGSKWGWKFQTGIVQKLCNTKEEAIFYGSQQVKKYDSDLYVEVRMANL